VTIVALTYKPRLKMRSWAPPFPPRPKRSRFLLWAVAGWLLATGIGYRWVVDIGAGASDEATSDDDEPEESAQKLRADMTDDGRATAEPPQAPSVAHAEPPQSGADIDDPLSATSAERTRTRVTGEILSCDEFIKQAGEPRDNRLPAHLGRSALDVFIGENDWAKPCRKRHRLTAPLCVAIQDGAVRGLSVHTSPRDLTLETCLREQAAKLVLPPDSTPQVVRTTLSL
jgi:hypothetical protein